MKVVIGEMESQVKTEGLRKVMGCSLKWGVEIGEEGKEGGRGKEGSEEATDMMSCPAYHGKGRIPRREIDRRECKRKGKNAQSL